MNLPDACRRGRFVVERLESVAPLGSELLVEHLVYLLGRQRRGGGLELVQRLAVRLGEFLRNCRLHDAERLAQLHRAALEFAQHREQLLGRLRAQLRVDLAFVAAGELASEAHGGATGHPQGDAREFGSTGRTLAWDLGHHTIMSDWGVLCPKQVPGIGNCRIFAEASAWL